MKVEIVASNALVKERAERLRDLLNSGHSLHLFKNPLVPTPASTLVDFKESTFPGYAPINLDGIFKAPTKVIDGEFQTETPAKTFTCTGPTNELCHGWYVRDNKAVKLSHGFFVPAQMTTGRVITFRIFGQVWSTSIL